MIVSRSRSCHPRPLDLDDFRVKHIYNTNVVGMVQLYLSWVVCYQIESQIILCKFSLHVTTCPGLKISPFLSPCSTSWIIYLCTRDLNSACNKEIRAGRFVFLECFVEIFSTFETFSTYFSARALRVKLEVKENIKIWNCNDSSQGRAIKMHDFRSKSSLDIPNYSPHIRLSKGFFFKSVQWISALQKFMNSYFFSRCFACNKF